eukprot:GILK01005131.1.p1 GENE.GILK01005131.1~~GILK01005131.1.p1  ORF type:complete len:380 (+),score=57.19 GILK01005131.1:55-1140(+)
MSVPSLAQQAVLVSSSSVPEGTPVVKGYDFNKGVNYKALLNSYKTTGYQATSLAMAIDDINEMLKWRLSDVPVADDEPEEWADPVKRSQTRCKIFLGYTSNLVSSGLRDTIRFLVQHKMVDVLVTTAGGIEEDIIKCLAPTFLGDFSMKGAELRMKGLNRIGNLLVPNSNYCSFEDFITPIFDAMAKEQHEQGINWTPSKLIHRLGKEIDNPESICYWAYKNNIPIFSPAITDGSIGDMLYFYSYKDTGLRLDIVEDIRRINDEAVWAKRTGMIILGGGLIKHHICNANLMRNGADHAIYINTAQEFDGSDAGARPDEAVSWGKIRIDAQPVKVYADATLVFPLIVAETFAKDFVPTATDA